MTKQEFEKKIKKSNYVKEVVKEGLFKKIDYYVDHERFHIIACYKNDSKKYVVYFKDFERDVTNEIGVYETIEEAYDAMWKFAENN